MAALEVWLLRLRRMLRIKWIDKVSNEEALVRAGGQRCLLNNIQQAQFFGHMMRKTDWITSDEWEGYRQEVSRSTKIENHGSDESRDELFHNH